MRTIIAITLLTLLSVNIMQATCFAETAPFFDNNQSSERATENNSNTGTDQVPGSLGKINPAKPIITSYTKCLGKNKNGYGVKRYLYIQYPWTKFQNASIEVRIIGPKAKKQPQFSKPIFFMTTIAQIPSIKRDLAKKLLHRSGYSDNIEYDRSVFSNEGYPRYELVLANIKNLVGDEGVFFHARLVNPETNELETTLVFPELKNWAVDDDVLALELRGKLFEFDKTKREFEHPCELKIWFLKDDVVVWEETVRWPGIVSDTTPTQRRKRVNKDVQDDDPQAEARRLEEQEKKTQSQQEKK